VKKISPTTMAFGSQGRDLINIGLAGEQCLWQPERELQYDPPRPIALKTGKILTLTLVVFGLISFIVWGFLADELNETLWTGTTISARTIPLASGVLLLLVTAAYAVSTERDSRRLVSRGIVARGVVETVERKHGHGATIEVAAIRYGTPTGTHLVSWTTPCLAKTPEVGESVTILYLSERPETAAVYKDSAYRAIEPS
jgi:hypothetical protein